MKAIDYSALANMVRDALRASFTELLAAHPERTFYTFAIFTDDSLQFAQPVANTEEGLTATVQRYQEEVDSKYTRDDMRWSYGDWEFFPDVGETHFEQVNEILSENFCAEEEVFEQQIEPLWQAMLEGFLALEKEGFFGVGEARSKITLLVVGHVPEEIVDHWVTTLNPPEVARQLLEWNQGEGEDADADD